MDITVIAVGKLKEPYLAQGVEEACSRLRRRHQLRLIEVPDEGAPDRLGPSGRQAVLDREGERILRAIPAQSVVALLAVEGQPVNDEKFRKILTSHPALTFVIGGSLGLGERVKARGNLSVSLSPMTFPHQLTRLLLLEELNRLLS